eukprot:TRINITY_DN7529_c0_g2_i1.p1 TRINITY_DN7529_c0_g2~~TRINITY_DN7529_c0_g2_i1.p1  ORF type:complete len:353 (+),score=119.93 TRINITY_DN7529_c0_g2_i1:63-1061(+)
MEGAQKRANLTIDPLVMFSILDHHTRREQGDFVLGTLLGSTVDGVLQVRSCFPVPHSCSDGQLSFDLEFFRSMQGLHQKVNGKDAIVGWYATELTDQALQIHEHYKKEIKGDEALFLYVDPTLGGERIPHPPQKRRPSLNVTALITSRIQLASRTIGPFFKELTYEWRCHSPAEKVALDHMIMIRHCTRSELKTIFEGLPDQLPIEDLPSCAPFAAKDLRDNRNPYEKVHRDLLQIKAVLDKAVKYCDAVSDGRDEEDLPLMRALLNVVQSLPPVAPETFDKLFNATMQDMLMLNYLAKLTKTQVALMERLHVYIPDPKPAGREQAPQAQQG